MDYAIQTPRQLSAQLRALRKARGLSQAALGETLGVGQTRIARIEGKPTAVSVEQLIELLAVLGVQLVLRDSAGTSSQTVQASAGSGGKAARKTASGADW